MLKMVCTTHHQQKDYAKFTRESFTFHKMFCPFFYVVFFQEFFLICKSPEETRSQIPVAVRKKFFTMRVVKHWLPREVVDTPSWKHSRSGWTGLRVEDVPAHCRGVGLDDL